MVVVTGIRTAVKLAPIIYKVGKAVYKAGSKTRSFDRYIARHPKALRYGTAAVGIGTLVYDLTNIDYDSLIGPISKTYRKQQQARSNFQSSRSRQQFKADRCPVPSRRYGRQKYFNRSRYR